MSRIRLYLLGPVKATVDDESVLLKSSKIQALLALVGSHKEAVPRHHLASMLWESFPQERAWANLRHALHQVKNKIPGLLHISDTEVNVGSDVWVDVQHQDCCHLGTGEFCQGLDLTDCSAFETWLSTHRARWRDRTVGTLLQQADQQQDELALESAHQALSLDPLSERAHALVIKLLRERGDFAAARRQWDICLKTTLQELGSVPSILSCWGPALSEDAACRIYLLGQPRLVVNGAITALPYQKTTALLAYLACKGEAVERQQVRDLLWPGSRPDKAAANLRHALHFLRKCVGDVLCTHLDTLWLDPARFWLDTQWLEKSHQTYSSIGPFCEGLSLPDCPDFEAWLLQQRKRFTKVERTPRPISEGESEQRRAGGNLPAQLSTLVGADDSMSEAVEVLKNSRLLTLIGPAGVGKTRLALEVARLYQKETQVWLVEYGSLFDPDKVMPRLAAVLGISETPGEDLWEQLEEHFSDRESLIVLDNCEHLITATAELASELLKRFPKLTVVATSRELLRVPGETVLTLDPLRVPPSDELQADALMQYSSVELFVTRARASRPKFKLRNDNAPLVAEICRRLDGLPLAIELAAVRTRALSTKQIANGLRDRFRLLRGGPRTVPQRQQTLEQALAWSYNLLIEEEKSVFSQLSVLAAGFDLEAASAVCSSDEDPDLILDTLSALIDRSLVLCRESEEGFRYGMLETVRDFAYRELERSGTLQEIRERHFHYFKERASQRSQPGVAGLSELSHDHANFGVALDWALQFQPNEALKMAASLGDYWFYGGHFTEGSDYLERALQGGECPRAYLWSGRLHQAMGDYSSAQTEFGKSAQLSEEPLDQARALNARAQAGFTQADYGGSKHFAESSLDLWRQEGNRRGEVDTLSLLATAEICLGEWEAASLHLNEASEVCRQQAYQWGSSVVVYLRGLLALYQGRNNEAHSFLTESLEQCRALVNPPRTAVCLGNLGLCLLAQGKSKEAETVIEEGRELAETTGYKQVEAFLLYTQGYSELLNGKKREAQNLLQQSLRLMKAIGVKESLELVLLCISQTLEEEELVGTLRRSALTFKAQNSSVVPAYLGAFDMAAHPEALSIEEAVELALNL